MFTGTIFGQKYIHDLGPGDFEGLKTFNVTMSRNLVLKRVMEALAEEGVFFASEPWPNDIVRIYVKITERNALINAIEIWEARVQSGIISP